MRKALIAVIVATALFAVGAFAANFTVNAEDVASGADAVVACAAEVDVDFETLYDNAAPTVDGGGEVTTVNGDWTVAKALVTFYDGAGAPTAACEGFGANLAVMTGTSGTPAATGTATVGTGKTAVLIDLVPATLKAGDITGAAVLVDGQTLQVAQPGDGFTAITAP